MAQLLQPSMIRLMILLVATACIFVAAVEAQAVQQAAWLAAHNRARSDEGAGLPPLTWNTAAYDFALAYATQQAAKPGCPFSHSGSNTYGENLAWNGEVLSASATPPSVVNGWMSEKPNWNFASRTCMRGMCGHYTQVVWKATTSFGCASVLTPNWNCFGYRGGKFSVCSYYPPGNYVGRNPY